MKISVLFTSKQSHCFSLLNPLCCFDNLIILIIQGFERVYFEAPLQPNGSFSVIKCKLWQIFSQMECISGEFWAVSLFWDLGPSCQVTSHHLHFVRVFAMLVYTCKAKEKVSLSVCLSSSLCAALSSSNRIPTHFIIYSHFLPKFTFLFFCSEKKKN